jgi:hypothetical protein
MTKKRKSKLVPKSYVTCTIKKILIVAQLAPINGIALDQAISDYNKQMITLYDLSFPLNAISFRKGGWL